MFVTPEAVKLYLEIQHKKTYLFIGLCLAVWVCLKQGSENMLYEQLILYKPDMLYKTNIFFFTQACYLIRNKDFFYVQEKLTFSDEHTV